MKVLLIVSSVLVLVTSLASGEYCFKNRVPSAMLGQCTEQLGGIATKEECCNERGVGWTTTPNGERCEDACLELPTPDPTVTVEPASAEVAAEQADVPDQCGGGRCGGNYVTESGNPAVCDADGDYPCCSSYNRCGNGPEFCDCEGCVDYNRTKYEQCETGWLTRDVSRYCFYEERKTWTAASSVCSRNGGHILWIESPAENQYIQSQVNGSAWWWIGLSGLREEGIWKYDGVNHRPIYFNWYEGEPNNFRSYGENCVNLYGANGYWNDYSCGGTLWYICESN